MYRRLLLVFLVSVLFILPIPAEPGDLYTQSILLEVLHSDSDQLLLWARRLGLETSGGEQQLSQRILQAYGIPYLSLEEVTGRQDTEMSIQIESADSVSYDEVITLKGDVSLVIEQSEGAARIEISARELYIHQETRLITAVGDARIDSLADEVRTTFEAQLFMLRFDRFTGSLSDSLSTFESQNRDGDDLVFYIAGRQVDRSQDAMIIHDSTFSSDPEDPYFSLYSRKMKVLDDGDWFLTSGTLNIGRVPILYVPFFFYPARTLRFNPAFGIDSDRGLYLNTTIPLFGTPPSAQEKESSFSSFLRMGTVNPVGKEDQGELSGFDSWVAESGSYYVLYADMYEHDGVYLHSAGQLKELGPIDSLELMAGLGYEDSFRYAFNSSLTIDTERFDVSLSLPAYSDPYMLRDLSRRQDSFDLDALFSSSSLTSSTSVINDYSIELNTKIDLSDELLSPLISSLVISSLDGSIEFGDYQSTTGGYELTSLTVPRFGLQAKGRLFSFKKILGETEGIGEEVLTGTERYKLTAPGYAGISPMDDLIASQELSLLGPRTLPDALIPQEAVRDSSGPSFSGSSTYTLKESFSQEYEFDPGLLFRDTQQSLSFDLATVVDASGYLKLASSLKAVSSSEQRLAYSGLIDEYQKESSYVLQDTSLTALGGIATYRIRSYLSSSTDRQMLSRHEIYGVLDASGPSMGFLFDASFDLPPLEPVLKPRVRLSYLSSELTLASTIDDTSGVMSPSSYEFALKNVLFDKDLVIRTDCLVDVQDSSQSLLRNDLDFRILPDVFLGSSFSWALDSLEVSEGGLSISVGKASAEAGLSYFSSSTPLFSQGVAVTSWKVDSGKYEAAWSLWKDRITIDTEVRAFWEIDLRDYYDNLFQFEFSLGCRIAEFLDLSITSISKNTATYTYFPALREPGDMGILEDLLKSFNVFDRADRLASNFNLDSLRLSVVHYMKDWDLHADMFSSIGYNESSALWEWQPAFTVYLQWKAIPELDFEAEAQKTDAGFEYLIR